MRVSCNLDLQAWACIASSSLLLFGAFLCGKYARMGTSVTLCPTLAVCSNLKSLVAQPARRQNQFTESLTGLHMAGTCYSTGRSLRWIFPPVSPPTPGCAKAA